MFIALFFRADHVRTNKSGCSIHIDHVYQQNSRSYLLEKKQIIQAFEHTNIKKKELIQNLIHNEFNFHGSNCSKANRTRLILQKQVSFYQHPLAELV